MQVLISSARPLAALATKSGSASNGRAIDTRSASPAASTRSATAGSLIRLLVTSGTLTAPLSLRVTQVNAARGTIVAIVGMRASCQPMPVLMIVVAGGFDGLRELDDLLPGAAALDEVQHRQSIDDDEVGPDRRTRSRHDLERQPHAVPPAAAPAIAAPVGSRREKLVDEVTLAAHDFDAVVASLAREHGGAHEGRDLALHAGVRKLTRREGGDRRLEA